MGTGSGVCAVFAARHARRVVAVDINPAAVRCAGINALLNDLEHKIEVRHGDLFAPVTRGALRSGSVQPAVRARARRGTHRDRAWRSSDVAERFAAGLGAPLEAGRRRRSCCCRPSATGGCSSRIPQSRVRDRSARRAPLRQ